MKKTPLTSEEVETMKSDAIRFLRSRSYRFPRTEHVLRLINEREAMVKALVEKDARVRKVLEDEESRPGGWGPDVTCVAYLKEALAITPSSFLEESV